MKRERRKAVLVKGSFYLLCVFRGELIEHVFFGKSEEEVLLQLEEQGVKGELKGLDNDPNLVNECSKLLEQIEEKLKRNGILT